MWLPRYVRICIAENVTVSLTRTYAGTHAHTHTQTHTHTHAHTHAGTHTHTHTHTGKRTSARIPHFPSSKKRRKKREKRNKTVLKKIFNTNLYQRCTNLSSCTNKSRQPQPVGIRRNFRRRMRRTTWQTHVVGKNPSTLPWD